MPRIVQPEILDGLPPCNIDAIASRRDLVKINHLMGNYRWIRAKIKASSSTPLNRYLEIGAGDGTLAKKLSQHLPHGSYDALDFSSKPELWPAGSKWIATDLLQFRDYGQYTHLIANLILHHFKSGDLAALGAKINQSGVQQITACEPCRRSFHKLQLRAGKLIGFNYVTLNDGCISVDAGFRGDELPERLGLPHEEWTWQIEETWMGAYRMLAKRK
ncbi:hypothetical protein ACWPKO_13580 [Coraliomargarita sp. W4R53]